MNRKVKVGIVLGVFAILAAYYWQANTNHDAAYLQAKLNTKSASCTDIDGTLAFNDQLTTRSSVAGTIDGTLWDFEDRCDANEISPMGQTTILREYVCKGDFIDYIDITCPRYAPWCQDGQCVTKWSADDALKLNKRLAENR